MTLLENRRRDAEIAEKFFGWCDWKSAPPHYSTELVDAEKIIDRLRASYIEVIIGCFKDQFSVELRRWIKQEGIEGDPHTGRSRVTFVCITGAVTLPDALAQAVLRPETLEVLTDRAN